MSLLTVQRSPTPSETSEQSDTLAVLEVPEDVVPNLSSSASASEDFIASHGVAIALPSNERRQSLQEPPFGLQNHMHHILKKIRQSDNLKLAVKLEGSSEMPDDHHRYFCLVSYVGRQNAEESVILGVDLTLTTTTIGLVIPVMQDMKVHLQGDGGFTVDVKRVGDYLFKPVSVQALWTAFQAVKSAQNVAIENNYFANGLNHTWVNYYHANTKSSPLQINEWRRTDDSEENGAYLPPEFAQETDSRKRLLSEIRKKLREVMLSEDLDLVTVAHLRRRLAEEMDVDLDPFKTFIGEAVIHIFGQLESPSEIFDHVLLGSKWNACNLDELEAKNVGYIINITKEIDNFFPNRFEYHNVRLLDEEQSDLMSHWEKTHRYINLARDSNKLVLVHCRMGISRSAATVMAYAMKEYNWSFEKAYEHVKAKRSCVHPNPGFVRQLNTYEGILSAKSNREKFNVALEPSTSTASGFSATPVERSQLQKTHSESDAIESDQAINIEQDIFQYKQQSNDFLSISNSTDTSNSAAPSNPSIAPDPVEDAPPESGSCGGLINDPRALVMKSVRDDLIVFKDRTEAPWRRSLRRKSAQKSGEEVTEEGELASPNAPEATELCDEPSGSGVAAANASFRPDHSWIKPRQESFDGAADDLLILTGIIAGEEMSTDPRPCSEESEESSSGDEVATEDEGEEVVMRGDQQSDSLPPSGTVKRHSDRLEGLREATNGQASSDTAATAPPQPNRASAPPTADVYVKEDIPLVPGIVKKTKLTIEARERTEGPSPTQRRLSAGDNNSARHFSGGGLSPVSVSAVTPAVANTPRESGRPFSQILADGQRLLGESSTDAPPLVTAQDDPEPSQVRRKMLLLIRQVGDALLHTQRGGSCVQNVVREVESSVDRDPIPPVRHLVEVFRGGSGMVSSS